jgi:hypothetical protein
VLGGLALAGAFSGDNLQIRLVAFFTLSALVGFELGCCTCDCSCGESETGFSAGARLLLVLSSVCSVLLR